jgi:hypothetical protein
MKRTMVVVWSSGAITVISLLVLLGMRFTVWSGPNLEISSDGPRADVRSIFLGEYQLGISRLRVETTDTHSVAVDLNDSGARIPSVLTLQVGENEVSFSGGSPAHFVLDDRKSYELTLCGNNGWGRIRCSSKEFRLTSH